MAATVDALLDQFQLPHPEPNVYRLGQYAPVSIRDQIVRSCYLLDRLWVTGALAANSRLLIIGAGAAGVTAAMRAAHYAVQRVVLVDSSDHVLSLQAECASRWLDPAQYDWPALHWAGERWPIVEPSSFAWPTAKHSHARLAQGARGLACRRAEIFLALKADHFDGCYPLNRLVALLCVAFLRREHSHDCLLTFRAVTAVAPLSTSGGWGIPVAVEFALGTTCATTIADLKRWKNSARVTLPFDGIIIRHGIDPATLSIKTAGLRTQHVPAHLP